MQFLGPSLYFSAGHTGKKLQRRSHPKYPQQAHVKGSEPYRQSRHTKDIQSRYTQASDDSLIWVSSDSEGKPRKITHSQKQHTKTHRGSFPYSRIDNASTRSLAAVQTH